jgi:hypothetical protein
LAVRWCGRCGRCCRRCCSWMYSCCCRWCH